MIPTNSIKLSQEKLIFHRKIGNGALVQNLQTPNFQCLSFFLSHFSIFPSFVFFYKKIIISSYRRCFVEEGVLRNFAKFTGKPWHRFFPVYFAKFLRTPFLQNTSRQLLLKNLKLSFYSVAILKQNFTSQILETD